MKFVFMAFNLQHQGWSLYYQGWEKFLHKIFMANEKAKDVYMTDEEEKKYSQVSVEKVPPPTFRY